MKEHEYHPGVADEALGKALELLREAREDCEDCDKDYCYHYYALGKVVAKLNLLVEELRIYNEFNKTKAA